MAEDTFEVGQIVRHKAGGPVAVVAKVEDTTIDVEFWATGQLQGQHLEGYKSLKTSWRIAKRHEIEIL